MLRRSECLGLFELILDARQIEQRHRELHADLGDATDPEAHDRRRNLENLIARIDEEVLQIRELEKRVENQLEKSSHSVLDS